jgi:hypothetical protein
MEATANQPLTRADRAARTRSPLPQSVMVALACLATELIAYVLIVHEKGLGGDAPYYARIANHPPGPHNFPYAFRIGVPYLVHALPFSHAFSWEALALLAAAVAGGAMYALLREFDTEPWIATSLSIGFSVSPALLVVFLRNGLEVDAAAIMVITLGCLFIVRRQRLALALTLLAGSTVHESCLFLIPLAYAVWAERPIDRQALQDLAITAALPVALYIYLRQSIVAVGESYQPGYTGEFFHARWSVIREALQNSGWHVELRRVALVYGPLWIAAPAALKRLRFARRGLALIVPCVISMTFALDWGRAIFFAAPVFFVAGAYVVRDRRRLAVLLVAALFALDLGYAVYMQAHGVKHGLDTTGPPSRGPVS